MVSWPRGRVPFAVDELIEAARAIDRAALNGDTGDVASAHEIVETLAAYVDSLPVDRQPRVARGLVAALGERRRFTSTVPLKTLRTRAVEPARTSPVKPMVRADGGLESLAARVLRRLGLAQALRELGPNAQRSYAYHRLVGRRVEGVATADDLDDEVALAAEFAPAAAAEIRHSAEFASQKQSDIAGEARAAVPLADAPRWRAR